MPYTTNGLTNSRLRKGVTSHYAFRYDDSLASSPSNPRGIEPAHTNAVMDTSDNVERYQRFCRPGLVPLLQSIGLDAIYERAEGDYLWQRRDDRLVPVLDLVGGYGANLFGHHHPELVAVAHRHFEEKRPFHAQASCRPGAARLAESLCRQLGDYVVTFTNSGAETIEAALKHALLERPRPIFWAVKGAFHGKTLGAIQFTWSYRAPYGGQGPRVRFLDPSDPAGWHAVESEIERVSAVFLEPIAGEGGVRRLPDEFVQWISALCHRAGVPIVVDEIQSGMGRTGTFLASQQMGLEPDYLCLSKSLGGGLAKIGALLVKRQRFVEDFSIKHTSTFAEDDFSCDIACKALELLERDQLPTRCAALGRFLADQLEELRSIYPDEIREVRSHGLMIGLELQDHSDSRFYTLRVLSRQGYLGYFAAAYLLNVHDIRVVPTLSDPCTLRIEPSAYITEHDLTRFVRAAGALCEALRAGDVVHLTGHQIRRVPEVVIDYNSVPRPDKQEAPRTVRRVAFLGHLLLDEHATFLEPSLSVLEPDELEEYLDNTARIIAPTIFDRLHVRSRTGDEVHLSFVGFNLTSRQIAHAMASRDYKWIHKKIEAAVELAKAAKCQVVGFGGYTSVVTGNCRRIKTTGVALTSGNSLTVGMGVSALKEAARELGIELSETRLAVLGASGNIASTYALIVAPLVKEIVLIVRNLTSAKLEPLLDTIRQAAPETSVRVVDNLEELSSCRLIVTASNSPEPLIYPHHLSAGPVAICDISLPADVAEEVKIKRPDVLVITGGVVKLPHDHDFSIGGIPLSKGHVFACMGETLLMGLEGASTHGSYGSVTLSGVERAMAMAEKHGFTLGNIHENTPSNGVISNSYVRSRS